MRPDTAVQPDISIDIDDVVVRGSLVARRIVDDLSWGEGDIQPHAGHAGVDSQHALMDAVLDNIEPVSDAEAVYSNCTDGRLPMRLLNDEKVPVREQLVGADMVSAFYVAESLGPRFYRDPRAPVDERVHDVAEFLHENGLLPSSHVACGAAGGFVVIAQNIIHFSQDSRYIQRLQTLLPEGVFDATLHETMLKEGQVRLQTGAYEGLSAETFLRAAEKVSGRRAIAELRDDGRGVRGHVEEAVVRVRVPGKAINEAQVIAETGGRQVFGVNDDRMDYLARLFARGNDQDYRIAVMALEDFASSGHATLAKNLPTYIITPA
jgi:hypothetical protein